MQQRGVTFTEYHGEVLAHAHKLFTLCCHSRLTKHARYGSVCHRDETCSGGKQPCNQLLIWHYKRDHVQQFSQTHGNVAASIVAAVPHCCG